MDLPHWWQQRTPLSYALYPLSLLFRGGVFLRRCLYRYGVLARYRAPVPVVVVGNLTVGGNGKTPLVIALSHALQARGYRVGIITRGYGRQSALHETCLVTANARAETVGDEPLWLAYRSGAPVAVGRHRKHAITLLLQHHPTVNLILSDDGLQHYALARDVELVAVAPDLQWGNGFCLPAGALREPPSRLHDVTAVVYTDTAPATAAVSAPTFTCTKRFTAYRLDCAAPQGQGESISWQRLATQTCYVLTAIARPKRFLDTLAQHGITVRASRLLPDHAPLHAHDLAFAREGMLLVSSKDAVKIQSWYQPLRDPPIVVVDYELCLPPALVERVHTSLSHQRQESS